MRNETLQVPGVVLRSGGVLVVVDLRAGGLPVIRYWGADHGDTTPLADLLEALDQVIWPGLPGCRPTAVLPDPSDGWFGTPGLQAHRLDGTDWTYRFELQRTEVEGADVEGAGVEGADVGDRHCRVVAADVEAGVKVTVDLRLTGAGVLRVGSSVTNTGNTELWVDHLHPHLPVIGQATDLMDFSGYSSFEHLPQRGPWTDGTHDRRSRGGKPGHDSAHLLCVGEAGFDDDHGPVWGVHVAWSGNCWYSAPATGEGGRFLAGGEFLYPGEVVLVPGATYTGPELLGVTGTGLNALRDRFHREVRSHPRHPSTPRPVTVNTWEGMFFDLTEERMADLARLAARIGAERFVIDDGWFKGRVDDLRALGDWTVDADRFPNDLAPVTEAVRDCGLQFGLWVEPEMATLDADVTRAHPEWVLGMRGRYGAGLRPQVVLDLGRTDVRDHLFHALSALVTRYDLAYFKWDQNRYLMEAGGADGRPGYHRNTEGLLELLDRLAEAHPDLEIENCSSGGARISLDLVGRTSRLWPSDATDPRDREIIERSTSLLLPPELMATHLAPTNSIVSLSPRPVGFRGAMAIWGHMGIEWDLTRRTDEELDTIAGWVALHKCFRTLLHTGRTEWREVPRAEILVHAVVAEDGSEALYGLTPQGRTRHREVLPVPLGGLDPDRRYRIERVVPPGPLPTKVRLGPGWDLEPVELTGAWLGSVGVSLPPLAAVDDQILVHARAVGA